MMAYAAMESSFSVIHKFGSVGIFGRLKLKNKLESYQFWLIAQCTLDKFKFASELIWLATFSNLFSIEVVQKLQVCALLVNSNDTHYRSYPDLKL